MLLLRNAFASMKKKKKDTISLILLIFLATLLLAAGITVERSIDDFYYRSNERLNAAHYVVCIPNNRYQESYLDYLQQDERVSYAEIRETAMMNGATYEVNGGKVIIYANFLSLDDDAVINPFSVIEESDEVIEDPIYVPYFFKGNGYQIGDLVEFTHRGTVYAYHIAGYFETTWFGSLVSSMVLFYLPDDAYKEIYQSLGGGQIISARLYEFDQTAGLKKDFKEDTGLIVEAGGRDVISYDAEFLEMQSISVMIPKILTAIMLAFSIVIFAIIILVIRFRVYSHMEDNMRNMGVLGAVGYTGVQIRWLLLFEYLLAAVLGVVPGILASYGFVSVMGNFISGFMGVTWMSGIHLGIDFSCFAVVIVLVFLITYFFSRKLQKLSPVAALRGGVGSHSFRRNYLPLAKKILPVSLQLACKGMAANIRQYLMIAFILAGVSAAAALSLLFYSNMSGENSVLYKAMGFEKANVLVQVARHQDIYEFEQELKEMEGVRKTSFFYATSGEIEGQAITTYVAEEFDQLETIHVYEGSFPKYDNEIVLTKSVAKSYGKEIGDTILFTVNGVTGEYLICGYTQTVNNAGRMGIIRLDGIRRLNPSFEITEVNVYLEEGYPAAEFINQLEEKYQILSPDQTPDLSNMTSQERAQYKAEEKITNLLSMYGVDSADYSLSVNGEVVFSGSSSAYQIERIDNMEQLIETSIGSFIAMAAVLAFAILSGTLFITALILFLVIRYMILKRRQEFGVMKSLGYTSAQLRVQIALGFLPASALGLLAGCVFAGAALNPALNILLQPLGASNLDFFSNPLVLGMMFLGLLLYVFLIALLSSGKIKKITAYELFTD